MPESTSHEAASQKVEQNKGGHSHHGAEKQANPDKPAHEFGTTGQFVSLSLDVAPRLSPPRAMECARFTARSITDVDLAARDFILRH
jgi:hypothetical protein